MTAARDDRRASRPSLDARRRPGRGRRAPRSSTSSTRSAAASPRTRSAIAREGRATMAELGGEAQATVIGLADAAARGERRVRERDALPRPRLRRHALGLGRARLDRGRAGGARRGASATARAGGTCSPRSSPATRSSAGSAWRRRARSTRAASTRPRSAASSAPTAAVARLAGLDADDDDERARHRRLDGVGASSRTSPTGRRRSRCTPPGPRTARTSRRGSPTHGAAGPPSVLEGSSASTTPSSASSRARSTSTAQLADLGERWETPRIAYKPYPGLPLHPRLARRDGRGGRGRTFAPDEIEDDRRHACRRPASRSCSSRPARSRRRGPSTRASSRSSTRSRRCSCAATSASTDFTDEAIADPRVLALAAQGALRDEDYPTYPQAFPGGVRSSGSRRDALEADSPTSRAGPRTRCRPTRCARSSATNAALALADAARRRRSRRRSSRSSEQADLTAALAPLDAARRSRRVTPRRGELDRRADGDRRGRPRVRRPRRDPGRVGARARRRVPDGARRDDEARWGSSATTIPEEYGGLGLGLDTYALIVMELSRGWVTLSGIVNGSFIAATMIRLHGTEEQRERLLPRLASARDPRGVLDDRAARGLRRPVDPHDGRRATATTTSSTARRCGSRTAGAPGS